MSSSNQSREWKSHVADIKAIADAADVIVRGYAVSRCEDGIRVFNLNDAYGAAVFTADGQLVETNMDEIGVKIASDILGSSLKYMEA